MSSKSLKSSRWPIFGNRKQVENTSDFVSSLMRAYTLEPLGRIFVDKLHIPIGILWFVNLVLNYQYLAAQHDGKKNAIEILPEFIASLNIFLIVVGFIGSPLIFSMMLFYRRKIPEQLGKILQERLLTPRPMRGLWLVVYQLAGNILVQVLAVIIFPSACGILSIIFNAPPGIPAIYRGVTFIGGYSLASTFIQIFYLFLIRCGCSLTLRLQPRHIDKCGGLLPFGILAIYSYSYLFVTASMRAVVQIAGGDRIERTAGQITGISFIYLWLIFPALWELP